MQKTKRARFRVPGQSVLALLASLLSLARVTPAAMAAENDEVTVIKNVEAKMRDGATLRAASEAGAHASCAAGVHTLRVDQRLRS